MQGWPSCCFTTQMPVTCPTQIRHNLWLTWGYCGRRLEGGKARGLPSGVSPAHLRAEAVPAIPATHDTGNALQPSEFFDTRQVRSLRPLCLHLALAQRQADNRAGCSSLLKHNHRPCSFPAWRHRSVQSEICLTEAYAHSLLSWHVK